MKYLFLTIFSFSHHLQLSPVGKLYFLPQSSGNAKGYLTLRKKISIYAEDTTTFYLSLFRYRSTS